MGNAIAAQSEKYALITLLLFWCALIVVSSVYVTTPLVDTFSNYFHITQAMGAWTSSIFSFFYAVGFLMFGPLAERYGRKQIIVVGLGLLTVVTVLIGFTDNFLLLVTLRGVQGFVAATFAPTALAYVFDVFPKQKLVTVIGFISFGFVVAGIFGQLIAGIINQTFDWQVVFLFFGSIYLITMIAVSIILPSKSNNRENTFGIKNYLDAVGVIFNQRNFVLCYLITIMLLLTFIGMYTVLGDYLGSSPFYLSEEKILLVRSAGIIGMLLSPFAGVFVKRFGLLFVLKISLSLAVGGLFFMGTTAQFSIIVLVSVVFVAGISLTFPVIMMLVGELGGKQRGVAASFYAFILFIGATLGPVIGISLMSFGSYFVTFTALASLLGIALVAAFFIKIS
ncbi:MFS transporter [Virgibacillus sp. C22-A2]|uniref:MFS transporter n=1 Tax=Virgibacillus tibetensis TaxID=3042313 RepID=A0ABU6KJK5_9BACI|nr:MFS transporter [Virgibacillus sp. C22-A2]